MNECPKEVDMVHLQTFKKVVFIFSTSLHYHYRNKRLLKAFLIPLYIL